MSESRKIALLLAYVLAMALVLIEAIVRTTLTHAQAIEGFWAICGIMVLGPIIAVAGIVHLWRLNQ